MSDLVLMAEEEKEAREKQAKEIAKGNQIAAISTGIQLYSAKQLKSVSVGVHSLNDKMDQTNTALSGIDRGIGRVESQLEQTNKSMADMAREAALASQRQQTAHAESMAARGRQLAVSEQQKLLQASTLDENKKQTQIMEANSKIEADLLEQYQHLSVTVKEEAGTVKDLASRHPRIVEFIGSREIDDDNSRELKELKKLLRAK